MSVQPKKTFAMIDYERCNPQKCDPHEGGCAAASTCTRKVMKQIDGPFESPMVFQDLCMGCWDCMEACPLDAVEMRHVI